MDFAQVRPWLDCDRGCDFCYLRNEKKEIDTTEKRKRLMKLACLLYTDLAHFGTLGLIGGELFCWDDLDTEWACLADSIRLSNVKKLYLATHAMSGIERMIWFADMIGDRINIQFCTSYDPDGRFKDGEKEKWMDNVQKLRSAGYEVVISSTLTQALVTGKEQPFNITLQPIFITEQWLRDITKENVSPAEYNKRLSAGMTGLAKREDAINWMRNHILSAQKYSKYDDKHATFFWDWKDGAYVSEEFICNHQAECGHPYIAYCYDDDPHCSMCDAKKITEE